MKVINGRRRLKMENAVKLQKLCPPMEFIIVNVCWWDGYLEVFECSHVRQGGYILWMRLSNGQNRNIPLTGGNVRWFSTDPESHASLQVM
jgi:hypothetical protein